MLATKSITVLSVVLALAFLALTFSEVESESWMQTTQEDFLAGTLSNIDSWSSPGSLSMLKKKYETILSDREDFKVNANEAVRVSARGELVLLRYGMEKAVYDRSSIGAFERIGFPVWGDPSSGDVYIGTTKPTGNGFTIVNTANGTAITFRPNGVWDTTKDSEGTLITSKVKIKNNKVWHVWKNIEKGDIYACTDNGGLNIIHTHNTSTFDDDTVEIYAKSTSPGLLTNDPSRSWMDEEGNLYLGFPHDGGITIIHPDRTSTTYRGDGVWDSTDGFPGPLISSTPRLGVSTGYRGVRGDEPEGYATPLLRDPDGNLYVGTDQGLIILHWNRDLKRYDTSLTYRATGLYDTTDDNAGTLLDASVRIHPGDVSYAWRDDNGDIYIGSYAIFGLNGSIIHPDGTVTSPVFVGIHRWKDANGDIYVSDGRSPRIRIIHPDGTKTFYEPLSLDAREAIRMSFADKAGLLYLLAWVRYSVPKIYIISPNRKGISTSRILDVREVPAHSIRWQARTLPGSRVTLETRTGGAGSAWIWDFQDGEPINISSAGQSGSFDFKVMDGTLVFHNFSEWILPLVRVGSRSTSFPKGSIIAARVRGIRAKRPGGVVLIKLITDTNSARSSASVTNRWTVLFYKADREFSKVGFSVPQLPGVEVERIEVDWIAVESPEGWTDWVVADNPYGSIIPSLDKYHPYLQWRAIFTPEDPANALPALEEVTIASSGYPPKAIYISPVFDTGGPSAYQNISWDAEVPNGTSLKFQIRTASFKEGLADNPWLGPGDGKEFYTTSGMTINPIHNGDRWIQYRTIFETQDEMETPVLREVRIEYDMLTLVERDRSLGPVPEVTSLDQNYPNPFNAQTTIRYQLSQGGRVKLSIYNTLGQEIKRLVNGHQPAGYYTVSWDGKDDNTTSVGSGVYLYILQAGDVFRETRKMLLIQ